MKMQETEKFIEAVKRYPCIWNNNLTTHKCKVTKDAAWREIIAETSVHDIDTAKDKWKKLKDAFRETINKRKRDILLGKPHRLGRPYKFHHVMEFLIPILEGKTQCHGEAADRTEDFLSITDEEANESLFSSHSEQDGLAFVQVESERHEKGPVSSSASQRRGYKRNFKSEILDFLLEHGQRREASPSASQSVSQGFNEYDALDKFFLSMSESSKKLPAQMQLLVKRKVFNAVMEAEEENMRSMYNLSCETSEEPDVKPDIGLT